jgi:transcriptional regulator with XRE-family HTH domain
MPVYSSHLVDYPDWGVCQRIRLVRQSKDVTLRQLAALVGSSPAQLSKIENGQAVLDLALLGKIAAALDVPAASLLPSHFEQHFLIMRREEILVAPPTPRMLMGPHPGPRQHHNSFWRLADRFVGKHIEPILVEIQPLPEKDMHFVAHDHEEFMFVMDGEVEANLRTERGLATERLKAGDCMYYRSCLPHCHRSATDTPARTVNVIYSLRGATDADEGDSSMSVHQFFRRGVHTDLATEAAERIAFLRRSRGLSLDELAQSVGTSARHLAEIEKGERAVELDVLLMLARKFRRPIEYFFAATIEKQPSHVVHRRSEIKRAGGDTIAKASGDGRDEDLNRPLAFGFERRGMHPYYMQLKSSASDLARSEHHGEKFIHVLEGEVEFTSYADERKVTELLRPGDSLFLDASAPHCLRGRARSPYATSSADILVVFWSALGEEYLSAKALGSVAGTYSNT